MVWLQCLYSFFTVLRLWVVEGVLFTSSVNYCAQTCVWCIQWMPICTKFVTGASLRRTVFELCAFRSNTTTVHQNFGWCLTVGWASKKYVRKSCKSEEMALSMFQLLDLQWWSKKESDHATSLRNVDFHLQKLLRCMAFDVSLWKFLVTPGRKETNFPR